MRYKIGDKIIPVTLYDMSGSEPREYDVDEMEDLPEYKYLGKVLTIKNILAGTHKYPIVTDGDYSFAEVEVEPAKISSWKERFI